MIKLTKHIPRFFYPNKISSEQIIKLSNDDIHHLKNVLRYKGIVRIFNEHDGEWNAIYNTTRNQDEFIIQDNIRIAKQYKHKLILMFAPIKWKYMRILLMQSTEIGVDIFQPVTTKNTNQKFDKEKAEIIIRSSVEQSNRLSMPIIRKNVLFSEIGRLYNNHEILICNEALRKNVDNINTQNNKDTSNIIKTSKDPIIFIGPEGGFSKEELEEKVLFHHVSLGGNILRSETACTKALTMLQTLNGNFSDR